MASITRRSVLKSSVAISAAGLTRPSFAAAMPALPSEVLPYTTTSGLQLPPKGSMYLNFSFDFPEPSVAFEDLSLSARVHTYENAYAMDAGRMRVRREDNHIAITCDGLVWAGGQEKASGEVALFAETVDGVTTLRATAKVPGREVKAITLTLRGLPRGEISASGQDFYDSKDNAFSASWATLDGGMPSPLLVVRAAGKYTGVSLRANSDEVRTARFYLQPMETAYRAELVYEREAWERSESIDSPPWDIRHGDSYAAVAAPHYGNVEKAFAVKPWEQRTDVPQWMRDTKLVIALHGAHWTGYIFNDYVRQLEILRWTAKRMDPKTVTVFLPAWDGRYYWNYPAYRVDPRMGGEAGFHKLIDEGHKLGFHFVAMFGSNLANRDDPSFAAVSDAITVRPDGQPWMVAYVDWDNDRRPEGNYPFMNLGVPSWRKYLADRIVNTLSQFRLDGFFLDVVGCSENNRQADMFLGTRWLVEDIRKRCPGVLAVGEMHYDALMGCIPVFQADVTREYPAAYYRYGRMFSHLSFPAPGRGSSGVHEAGFQNSFHFPKPDQRAIPTLTVVDDTFVKHRAEMEQFIALAKAWRPPLW